MRWNFNNAVVKVTALELNCHENLEETMKEEIKQIILSKLHETSHLEEMTKPYQELAKVKFRVLADELAEQISGQFERVVSLGDSQPMLLAEIIKLRKFMGEFIDVFNDGKVEQAYDALYDIEQRYSKQSN